MKILISAASNWFDKIIVDYNTVESCLDDLRNGKLDVSTLIDKSFSSLCFENGEQKDYMVKKPYSFIVTYPDKNEKYDCRIKIYDDSVE